MHEYDSVCNTTFKIGFYCLKAGLNFTEKKYIDVTEVLMTLLTLEKVLIRVHVWLFHIYDLALSTLTR